MKIAQQLQQTNPFQGISGPATGPFQGFDINHGTLGDLISAILPYVFGAAGIALLIYLVLGGLQLMLSRGDPKAIQAAQAKITNALIGFLIVIIAYTVVSLAGRLLGITAFNQIFGTR